MREIRLYGSEGGGAAALPTPIFPAPLSRESPMARSGTTDDENGQFLSWEGQGPSGLEWVEQQRNPLRRSATAVASRHPSQGGDFRRGRIFAQSC